MACTSYQQLVNGFRTATLGSIIVSVVVTTFGIHCEANRPRHPSTVASKGRSGSPRIASNSNDIPSLISQINYVITVNIYTIICLAVAMDSLRSALQLWNPHWESGHISPMIPTSEHRRRAFQPQVKRVHELPFQLLVGPRQVGKTTLLGQLMGQLLVEGVPRKRILYAPLDVPPITTVLDGSFEPLIEAHERYVLAKSLGSDSQGPAYYFLDEVHALRGWSKALKHLFDTHRHHLRVLATGSSSAALFNAPDADHPGRIEKTSIHPLKFGEAMQVWAGAPFAPREGIVFVAEMRCRNALRDWRGDSMSTKVLRESFDSLSSEALLLRPKIERDFDRYLLGGGYPAVLSAGSASEANRFLMSSFDAILSKDVGLSPAIRKPHEFLRFVTLLAHQHGGKFVPQRFASDLGINQQTPTSWKEFAEHCFLVDQLPALSAGWRPVSAKKDKAFFQDPGMLNYLTARWRVEDVESSESIGPLLEGVLFDHLKRLQFNLLGPSRATLGYLPKPEVDLIGQLPSAWFAIECKASGDVGRAFMNLKVPRGKKVLRLVATRTKYDVDTEPWRLPTWLLCLI